MKYPQSIGGALASAILFVCAGCTGLRQPKSAGDYIDDKVQMAGVMKALAEDPRHGFDSVTVTAYKGTVRLRGQVKTADRKQRAEDAAKAVVGVRSVINEIQVRGSASGQ